MIRPSVTLNAGQFNRVDWDYLDLDGNPIAAPPAFTGLTLRIESDTGQLFHEDNLPLEPRTKQLPGALAWAGVRRITFIAQDETGNLYHSAAVKCIVRRLLAYGRAQTEERSRDSGKRAQKGNRT